jgi:hypothetical protein
MKKLLVIAFLIFNCAHLYAQDASAIKLFVYADGIAKNNPQLPPELQERLFRKTTQLINQTGIAELGYSSFLVSPKLDIVNVGKSETGTLSVYLAQCELSITVERMTIANQGGAVFATFTKSVSGSGMSEKEAKNNAVNSISASDPGIVKFLTDTKTKINTYFQTNCGDVMKQAQQALALKRYTLAISLYFSVPSNAPCYKEALDASEKVYNTYTEDQCNDNLVRLKTYVALANTPNQSNKTYIDQALEIIGNLSPASKKCYAEAAVLIAKLEGKLNDQQQKEWDLIKKIVSDDASVKKERYKAIGRISSSYQPAVSEKTIIIH